MKLSESVAFMEHDLTNLGFVDLGQHTPENQKDARADQALIFLFQPFRGQWVQSIAAFLSKGCAPSTSLKHLTMECIILLQKSGFHVDVVTSDGATWNSCVHPYTVSNGCSESSDDNDDPMETRRLWFCSDFSHLLKNLRNFLVSNEETNDWWERHLGLKIAHKLTHDHLNPQYYQKMNLGMALDVNKYEFDDDLKDCEATIIFVHRINNLIKAMTSRSSENTLKKDSTSYNVSIHFCQSILEFRNYLCEWKKIAATKGSEMKKKFMSESTYYGFHITLRTTIELMDFLTTKCGFNFLMTSRLNQDSLELIIIIINTQFIVVLFTFAQGMFGMIRGCCGSTDTPDPLLFIQIYRLLSFYSLVRLPKGSNVEGIEIFDSLLSMKDIPMRNENKDNWNQVLDEIITCGTQTSTQDAKQTHDYDYISDVNKYVQTYFAGFISRKVERWTSCSECVLSVTKKEGDLRRDEMINLLTKGYLKYPSDSLVNLLSTLEHAILQTVGFEKLKYYTFQHISQNILSKSITFVGCSTHKETLTRTVINYYLIARAKILCKKSNRANNEAKKKEREFRKRVKLVRAKKNIDLNIVKPAQEKEKTADKSCE
ncbi:hypothetical protein ALC62_12756 [Cyphomyrmex costatus]|uniref:Transposable element P transposase-like RNase H domain-containing protein n=1 Tax=Cyphomyrmex costatus TaxID=456900 RepID=A0A151IAT8_9HYME|nr:hypothetical protein ALC62_12756 [Cyphomyrmex costatus]